MTLRDTLQALPVHLVCLEGLDKNQHQTVCRLDAARVPLDLLSQMRELLIATHVAPDFTSWKQCHLHHALSALLGFIKKMGDSMSQTTPKEDVYVVELVVSKIKLENLYVKIVYRAASTTNFLESLNASCVKSTPSQLTWVEKRLVLLVKQGKQQPKAPRLVLIALRGRSKILTTNAKPVLRASTRMIQMRKYAKIVVPVNMCKVVGKRLAYPVFRANTDELTVQHAVIVIYVQLVQRLMSPV